MTAVQPGPRPSRRDYVMNVGFPVVLLIVVVGALYGPGRGEAGRREACSHNPAELATPTALAVAPSGALVVLQQSAGCLTRFDGDNFEILVEDLAREPLARGRGNAVAIAPDGTVYLGEEGRVRRVTADGDLQDVADLRSEIRGLAVDNAGNVFAATFFKVTRIAKGGTTTTVMGEGSDNPVNGGSARATRVSPEAIAVDSAGNVYITEYFSNQIIKADPADKLTIVAGTGQRGFEGDGGPATAAKLASPMGIAAAPDGTLYVADVGNYRLRRIDTSGTITTVAGNGDLDFYGETGTGPALDVAISPRTLALSADTIYFTDPYRSRIQVLDLPAATVRLY